MHSQWFCIDLRSYTWLVYLESTEFQVHNFLEKWIVLEILFGRLYGALKILTSSSTLIKVMSYKGTHLPTLAVQGRPWFGVYPGCLVLSWLWFWRCPFSSPSASFWLQLDFDWLPSQHPAKVISVWTVRSAGWLGPTDSGFVCRMIVSAPFSHHVGIILNFSARPQCTSKINHFITNYCWKTQITIFQGWVLPVIQNISSNSTSRVNLFCHLFPVSLR